MTDKLKLTAIFFSKASVVAIMLAPAGYIAQAAEVEQQESVPVISAGDAQLGDIIVTARKQSESLMKVPVAVSAVNGAVLESKATTNLAQIAQLVPQVTMVQGNSGSGATFSIRGLGSSFLDAGLEQTVAVNIDGMPVGRGHIIAQAFFDIAQVEVLKGPQALFFGKNSPAGVVSITSKGPGNSLEGMVLGGYEFVSDERYIEAAVGGPVTSTLGARIAVRASKSAGFLHNRAGPGVFQFSPGLYIPGQPVFQQPSAIGRQGGSKTIAGRATVEWKPTSDFQATLKVQGGHNTNDGINALDQPTCFAGQTVPGSGGGPGGAGAAPDPFGDCKLDHNRSAGRLPSEIAANFPGARDGKAYGYVDTVLSTLSMKYDLGDFNLSSVTGYFYLKTGGFDALDNTSLAAANLFSQEKDNAFSQELRLSSSFDGPLNFTVGGFYEHVKYVNTTNILLGFIGIPALPDPRTGWYNLTSRVGDNRNKAISAFGQLRWKITDTLELSGGARWTKENKKSLTTNNFVNQAFPLNFIVLPEGASVGGKMKDTNVSPEATLSWSVTPDILLYGAYKTGYKSGGFSSPQLLASSYNNSNIRFEPEKAKGGEIGLKATLLDRSMRLQLTGYRYTYTNLQVSVFDNASSSFIVKNAASVRIQGLEGSLNWRLAPGLILESAVGYNRARYLSYPTAACSFSAAAQCVNNTQDLSGQQLVRAPDWSGNIGATYDIPVTSDLVVSVNGDVNFTSGYFPHDNNEPLARQKAYQQINGFIRVHPEDDRWSLALIGRNLNDKLINTFATDNIGDVPTHFNSNTTRGRQVTVQGTFRF